MSSKPTWKTQGNHNSKMRRWICQRLESMQSSGKPVAQHKGGPKFSNQFFQKIKNPEGITFTWAIQILKWVNRALAGVRSGTLGTGNDMKSCGPQVWLCNAGRRRLTLSATALGGFSSSLTFAPESPFLVSSHPHYRQRLQKVSLRPEGSHL